MARALGFRTDRRFNHAANDSPRSGSSKRLGPAIGGVVLVAIVALTIWFVIG